MFTRPFKRPATALALLACTALPAMAAEAAVAKIVATHLSAGARITPEMTDAWAQEISAVYGGEVAIAKDLQDY